MVERNAASSPFNLVSFFFCFDGIVNGDPFGDWSIVFYRWDGKCLVERARLFRVNGFSHWKMIAIWKRSADEEIYGWFTSFIHLLFAQAKYDDYWMSLMI